MVDQFTKRARPQQTSAQSATINLKDYAKQLQLREQAVGALEDKSTKTTIKQTPEQEYRAEGIREILRKLSSELASQHLTSRMDSALMVEVGKDASKPSHLIKAHLTPVADGLSLTLAVTNDCSVRATYIGGIPAYTFREWTDRVEFTADFKEAIVDYMNRLMSKYIAQAGLVYLASEVNVWAQEISWVFRVSWVDDDKRLESLLGR